MKHPILIQFKAKDSKNHFMQIEGELEYNAVSNKLSIVIPKQEVFDK